MENNKNNQNNPYYELIAPIRTIKEPKDKMYWVCVILLGSFIVFSSAYIGHWYFSEWSELKSENMPLGLNGSGSLGIPYEAGDVGEVCPFNSLLNDTVGGM